MAFGETRILGGDGVIGSRGSKKLAEPPAGDRTTTRGSEVKNENDQTELDQTELDQTELDQTLRTLRPMLVRALTVQTGSRVLTEDLAQDTLVRCIERWATLRLADSSEAWAMRVAMNLAKSRWRRLVLEQRHRTVLESEWSQGPTADERSIDAIVLSRALAGLSHRQRAAVVCRHQLGFDVATTAAVLKCAEGTVKSLTSKGLAHLRSQLNQPQLLGVNTSAIQDRNRQDSATHNNADQGDTDRDRMNEDLGSQDRGSKGRRQ